LNFNLLYPQTEFGNVMNILHYLNVIIGFSLVMLLLSIVTSLTAQFWLVLFKTKARAVGNGLSSILQDIGLAESVARQKVNDLLDNKSPLFGKNKWEVILSQASAFFLAGAPKHIGREEFVLLLLRKAGLEDELARSLGFKDKAQASGKLRDLEQQMLAEETSDPSLPSQVWRAKAMQKSVPELASKIFARFDEVMDRVIEDVSAFGKLLGIIITLPLLLVYWPVDSIDLFNRLSNDQILSEKLATIAEANIEDLNQAHGELLACRKDHPEETQPCQDKSQALDHLANNMMTDLSAVSGLFGKRLDQDNSVTWAIFFKEVKIAKLTSGIFLTWILVSLGSAFWLGVLNKMLGIRSELGKKLDAQRQFRADSQAQA
jgi:hypothetical protein